MFLGSRVDVIWPVVPSVAAVTGDPGPGLPTPEKMDVFKLNHSVWFRTLKASPRICREKRSLSLVFLKMEKFQLLKPGLRKISRPVFPSEPFCGWAKASGLNHSNRVCVSGSTGRPV